MAAGVTSRHWDIGDIVDVLEAWEKKLWHAAGQFGLKIVIEYEYFQLLFRIERKRVIF